MTDVKASNNYRIALSSEPTPGTDPLYDSRNPNHGRIGGLRVGDVAQSASVTDERRCRKCGTWDTYTEEQKNVHRLRRRTAMTDAKTMLELADANREDAEQFCKGAFGQFVTDVSQYTEIVAKLLQHVTERALSAQCSAVSGQPVAWRYIDIKGIDLTPRWRFVDYIPANDGTYLVEPLYAAPTPATDPLYDSRNPNDGRSGGLRVGDDAPNCVRNRSRRSLGSLLHITNHD